MQNIETVLLDYRSLPIEVDLPMGRYVLYRTRIVSYKKFQSTLVSIVILAL